MRRILLVIEDFNELIYIQTVLKKIGFDVEGVSQIRKFEDILLGFNPQSIVVTAKGSKIDGLTLAPKIKRIQGLPHIILLKGATVAISDADLKANHIDLVVDTPVNVSKLLIGLSTLHGLEESALLAKLSKLQSGSQADSAKSRSINSGLSESDLITVKGHVISEELIEVEGLKGSDSFLTDETADSEKSQSADYKDALISNEEKEIRRQRYKHYLEKIEAKEAEHFSRDRILQFNKWIRSQPQADDIESIEEERKEYVRKLFKKT